MNYLKSNKFKIVFCLSLVIYILFCQSCARMRMSARQTRSFFKESKTVFLDSSIVVDGDNVHFIQTGNNRNPTLFFIHGSPGSWDAYKAYLKDSLLLRKFRLIAIDRPGFGYSDFGNARNLFEQAHIIEKFVHRFKNDKSTFLVGHSYGGPLVVQMAVNKPKDYDGIVVLSGAVDPDAENPENWRLYFTLKPIRYLVPGALRPANDELWWLKNDLKVMKPTLNKISTNVVLIHGTKDRLVPYANVSFMKSQFTQAKTISVVSIQNADHFIPWTHFDIIRNKLLELH